MKVEDSRLFKAQVFGMKSRLSEIAAEIGVRESAGCRFYYIDIYYITKKIQNFASIFL